MSRALGVVTEPPQLNGADDTLSHGHQCHEQRIPDGRRLLEDHLAFDVFPIVLLPRDCCLHGEAHHTEGVGDGEGAQAASDGEAVEALLFVVVSLGHLFNNLFG